MSQIHYNPAAIDGPIFLKKMAEIKEIRLNIDDIAVPKLQNDKRIDKLQLRWSELG